MGFAVHGLSGRVRERRGGTGEGGVIDKSNSSEVARKGGGN